MSMGSVADGDEAQENHQPKLYHLPLSTTHPHADALTPKDDPVYDRGHIRLLKGQM